MGMKTSFLLLLSLFLSSVAFAQKPKLDWVKGFGGKKKDYARSVAIDQNGDVLCTGSFMGTSDFDPNIGVSKLTAPSHFGSFVQKLSAEGELLWAKGMDGVTWGHGFSVCSDPLNHVIQSGSYMGTADFDSSKNSGKPSRTMAFVRKLDEDGNELWRKSFVSKGSSYSRFCLSDEEGNVYVSGGFMKSIDLDPGTNENRIDSKGGYDGFLVKLDTEGNFLWGVTLVGDGNDVFYEMDLQDNRLVLVGNFERDATLKSTGKSANLSALGFADAFALQFNTQGELLWHKQFGGDRFDQAQGVDIDKEGNVLVTGCFEKSGDFNPNEGVHMLSTEDHPNRWVESQDIFILKLDSMGGFEWAKGIGGVYHDNGFCVETDTMNNVYLGGIFHRRVNFNPGGEESRKVTSNGQHEGFVHKLNADGEFQWVYALGSFGWDFVTDLAIDSLGALHVSGYFSHRVDFDPSNTKREMEKAGDFDGFIQKLRPETPTDLTIPDEDLFSAKGSSNDDSLDLTLFPNPADDYFTLELPIDFEQLELSIMDSNGKQVHQETFVKSTTASVDVSGLSNGVYLINLKVDGVQMGKKLVVQR